VACLPTPACTIGTFRNTQVGTHKPLSARLTHGDVFHAAKHIPVVSVANPAELGQEQAIVALIKLDLFRVGVTEAIMLPLLFEARRPERRGLPRIWSMQNKKINL